MDDDSYEKAGDDECLRRPCLAESQSRSGNFWDRLCHSGHHQSDRRKLQLIRTNCLFVQVRRRRHSRMKPRKHNHSRYQFRDRYTEPRHSGLPPEPDVRFRANSHSRAGQPVRQLRSIEMRQPPSRTIESQVVSLESSFTWSVDAVAGQYAWHMTARTTVR